MSQVVWGGRFESAPDPSMIAFTSSADVDVRLLPYDCVATKAHARALAARGLVDGAVLVDIDRVLDRLVDRFHSGEEVMQGDEDVHSLVERVLTEQLGDVGRRIHAGRSRNDLVATDLRLWCRDAATRVEEAALRLVETLCVMAAEHASTVMPGYTHLQRAQPISLGFHLVAHATALTRDVTRLRAARAAANVSALGAGALAGNTLELDAELVASELGFDRTFTNAMDAVADRDFAIDLAYACALCMVHLSRLAEEIVLWTSSEFAFAKLSDEWSTGSSMMPQKRNPDVAELVRGRAAVAVADVTSLLSLLKGLPLAYNRDLQEDKALTFAAADKAESALAAMRELVASLTFDEQRLAEAAGGGGAWATDLAEELVRRGVPFRAAHEAAATAVREIETRGDAAAAFDAAGAADLEPAALMDPAAAVGRRASAGGCAPERVLEQVQALRALVAAT